jgi:starch phosphorylase
MKILGRLGVFPPIPQPIARLHELAFNLWWSWHPPAQELFRTLDPALWEAVNHNPVALLSRIDPRRLDDAADLAYREAYRAVLADFDAYMGAQDTWFTREVVGPQEVGGRVRRTQEGSPTAGSPLGILPPPSSSGAFGTIAYFSLEFGLHEALPIYSGGLGVLAGDHCKEASDLGLPYVGIGFLYPQGYFRQTIARDCAQEATAERLHFAEMPATPALTPSGAEAVAAVDLPGRRVYAKVWQIRVGRVTLYLLDTDVPQNAASDRELFASLYRGDHDVRVAQEFILGIGGVRALRALGIAPTVWHMNEGHAAFLGLELIRELVSEARLDFNTAREVVAGSSIFTTHTPVPAGNDAFNFDLIDRYFSGYWPQLGLDRDGFMALGRQETDGGSRFGMTALALRLSSQHNGVSALHGSVARAMWQSLWPGVDTNDVPIDSITNGVHTASWLAPELAALYGRVLAPDWQECLDDPATWAKLSALPDAELWDAHQARKAALIREVRRRVRAQRLRQGESPEAVAAADELLDPHALTIGFARRFATYKRATLVFRDLERLRRLLTAPGRPVQLIFAGKAHPADEPGKALIRQICALTNDPTLAGRVVFVEGYDMALARLLVAGVDVWLNTPRRPMEASGTSGQKASLNGIPNASILDGWWAEGYNGRNGWAIGEERDFRDEEVRADADNRSLYDILENHIVPLYYEVVGAQEVGGSSSGTITPARAPSSPTSSYLPPTSSSVPLGWTAVMKEAVCSIAPRFSTRRMVKEYTARCYLPAARQYEALTADRFHLARDLAGWKAWLYAHWHDLDIRVNGPVEGRLELGASVEVAATVIFGSLNPRDVVVELVSARDDDGRLVEVAVAPLEDSGAGTDGRRVYRGQLTPHAGGSLVYGVRVLPVHHALLRKHELGLVRWA